VLNISAEEIKNIFSFKELVSFLHNRLNWPIESEDFDDLYFEYKPKGIRIAEEHLAKITIPIKQLRSLTDEQPWGIFYIEFEHKKLPIVVLRRILYFLITWNRKSNTSNTWYYRNLLFFSHIGENSSRSLTLTIFSDDCEDSLKESTIKSYSCNKYETHLHYLQSEIDLVKLQWPNNTKNVDDWKHQWQRAFYVTPRQEITSSKDLSKEMAKVAKEIREQIKTNLKYESNNGPLHEIFTEFKDILVHDLDIEKFSDMYAQTVTYGLFTSRASHDSNFLLNELDTLLKRSNPFLQNLFKTIINKENFQVLEELGIVDLIELFNKAQIKSIMHDFKRKRGSEDPVIHFYEMFLKEYNPELKTKRGVFYTPDSVVSFMVRSTDQILTDYFHFQEGLLDDSINRENNQPNIQILDPATGTGTFITEILTLIKKKFDNKHQTLSIEEKKSKWSNYIENTFFKKIAGFELMLAPYSIAHFKLGLKLREFGYVANEQYDAKIYLSNTLEESSISVEDLYENVEIKWLAEEEIKAKKIINSSSINIIIGNPPYSGHSANQGDWIAKLMRGLVSDGARKVNYFSSNGKPLNEANPKWLNDDYVKFIRFGQWRIDKTEHGILAYITNHGYLDNPTFRGMRFELLSSFDKIFIINLHGNAIKQEQHSSEEKDKNVFDIKQGVAIVFFVKLKKKQEPGSKVYYFDLWGSRDTKFEWLDNNDLNSVNWIELEPIEPFFLFVPQNNTYWEEYTKGIKLTEIFEVYSAGIATARDHFTIYREKSDLITVLKDFVKLDDETARKKYDLRNDSQDWKVYLAKQDIISTNINEKNIVSLLYRPFDFRYTYYTGKSGGFHCRPRSEVMKNMILGENIGFSVARSVRGSDWRDILASKYITEFGVISTRPGNTSPLFPLFIYTEEFTKISKKINYKLKSMSKIEDLLGLNFSEQEISDSDNTFNHFDLFHYIYGLLFSNWYRTRFSEFIKMDFPHIIFPKNKKIWKKIIQFGADLIALHTFDFDYKYSSWSSSKESNPFITMKIDFIQGINGKKIGKITKKNFKENKIFIDNKESSSYFYPIEKEIWEYFVGSYQIAYKWLYDKRCKKNALGITLLDQEIEMYKKILHVISLTIKITNEIDEMITELSEF
jgi:predicted helicase